MIPGLYDIEIFRGGTFGFEAVGTDGVGVIDFLDTYDKARMDIRPAWIRQATAGQEPLASLTTENGGIELTVGAVNVAMAAVDTSALAFNNGVYSIELVIAGPTEAEDIVDILLYGKVNVSGERTL